MELVMLVILMSNIFIPTLPIMFHLAHTIYIYNVIFLLKIALKLYCLIFLINRLDFQIYYEKNIQIFKYFLCNSTYILYSILLF